MTSLNVLISGAGIAGPVLAFFLTRTPGIQCTIVERAPELRSTGQQVDIRGKAVDVIRRMGLEERIRSSTTKEKGIHFVNGQGIIRATFPVGQPGGGSLISDIEILRGDLAKIFYDATHDTTRYIFGDYITGVSEDASGATVDFAHGATAKYDIIVAADGMRSATRKLVFGADQPGTYRSLNQYTAFFSIPALDPAENWACWYSTVGGRCILLRPDGKGTSKTRAYLSIMGQAPKGYEKIGIQGQKELMERLFADAGWEAKRVIEGMRTSEDFYMQEIAQVKLPRWSKGRVAVLGDAGYCPSPISGKGTTLAIIAAYVLAGEITQHRDDLAAAFDGYEKEMRPLVESSQSLPPGAPAIANPTSWWGIAILYALLSFISWTGVADWLGALGGPSVVQKFKLPDYGM